MKTHILLRVFGGVAAGGVAWLALLGVGGRADATVLFPEPQPRDVLRRAPADAGPDASASPSSAPVFKLDTGGVTPVQPGQVAGYGITVPTRGTYRIVWTGNAGRSAPSSHRFTGSLVTKGQFVRVIPGCAAGACALEPGDVVSRSKVPGGGERIDWDTSTLDGLDGFDVEISMDAEPLYVDPLVEGLRKPTMIFFRSGATSTNPTTVPFGATTQ
jgi:hypothetical protein